MQSFGISPDAAKNWTIGTIIDYCHEHNRLLKLSQGQDVKEPDTQYKQLKAIEPLVYQRYINGEIDEKEYKLFKDKLNEWENMQNERRW